MQFYVYVLRRKSDGAVIYVGKGTGRRMDMHAKFASAWTTRQQHNLYTKLRALRAAGDDFYAEKIFESDDEGEVLQRELDLINTYGLDNLYNGVSAHVFGVINSARALAAREAISRARVGMKFSDEHRANIRKALLTRPPPTPEQRQRQALAQTGIKHKKHSNALPQELKRQSELSKHNRYYQNTRERRLVQKKSMNDVKRLQQWQAELTRRGLPLDTPLPSRISPLATYSPEHRAQRKRARERVNHALRNAIAAGDQIEIDRLRSERSKLDEAQRIVDELLCS